MKKGFTLIELLVVIAIIGILSSAAIYGVRKARDKAYLARSKAELSSMEKAIHLYMLDNNFNYPPDTGRGMPPGLEEYLTSAPDWPNAPWPGSFFDWDYWDPDGTNPDAGTLAYPPDEVVYQITVRFCEAGDPSSCRFPGEEWAEDFDVNSGAYWCISGPCRAHGSEPFDHPGCCIGGNCPSGAPKCQ